MTGIWIIGLPYLAFWLISMAVNTRWTQRQAAGRESTVLRERERARARAESDEFRRPAEFGPLSVPWGDIERIRLAIITDQLAAARVVGTDSDARAVAAESTEAKERTRAWLESWRDGGVITWTGQAA